MTTVDLANPAAGISHDDIAALLERHKELEEALHEVKILYKAALVAAAHFHPGDKVEVRFRSAEAWRPAIVSHVTERYGRARYFVRTINKDGSPSKAEREIWDNTGLREQQRGAIRQVTHERQPDV